MNQKYYKGKTHVYFEINDQQLYMYIEGDSVHVRVYLLIPVFMVEIIELTQRRLFALSKKHAMVRFICRLMLEVKMVKYS